MQYLSSSLSRVLLPSFSRIQDERERLQRSFRTAMLLLGALLFPLCFGIAGGAREIVLGILGNQWTDSIPILRILALSTPFILLSHIEAVLLEATAKLTVKIWIQLANILLLCGLFFLLLPYGLVGLASAVLLSSIGLFLAYTAALKSLLSINQLNTYRSLLPGCLSGCIILFVLTYSSALFGQMEVNIVFRLIAQVIIGASLFYLFLVSPLQKSLRDDVKGLLARIEVHSPLRRACKRLLWI